VIDLGTFDITDGTNAALLRNTVRDGACRGMDGTCTASFASSRRIRRLSTETTLEVERIYGYGSSRRKDVSLAANINRPVADIGASVGILTQTSLEAETTVTKVGNPESSEINNRLTDTSTFRGELGVWLPGITLDVSEPTLRAPPPPPSPPPPLPPPPSPASPVNGTDGFVEVEGVGPVWLRAFAYIGFALLGVLVAIALIATYRRRRFMKGPVRVLPGPAPSMAPGMSTAPEASNRNPEPLLHTPTLPTSATRAPNYGRGSSLERLPPLAPPPHPNTTSPAPLPSRPPPPLASGAQSRLQLSARQVRVSQRAFALQQQTDAAMHMRPQE